MISTLFAVVLSLSVAAQENTNSSDQLKSDPVDNEQKIQRETSAKVEKIEVTGSYIKRIDIEGPSPLVQIQREKIELSGNTTVEDVLKESAYFEAVYGGGKSGYKGHARFHGQHAGNTLILLNGMRLPKEEGSFYTSVSYLPTSVLERIDLLKDGSSALYGSDAMAGVVNFITRDDLDGGQVSVKYSGNAEGVGTEQNYVASFGKSYSRGSFIAVAQFRNNSSVFESDLGSYSNDPTFSKSQFSSGKGRIGAKKFRIASDDCTAAAGCVSNPFPEDQYTPETKEWGSLISGNYDINDSMNIAMTAIYSKKKVINIDRTLPISLSADKSINITNKDRFRITEANNEDRFSVKYYPREEIGAYVTERVADTFSLQSKLSREFASTWNWNFMTSYTGQEVTDTTLNGDAPKAQMQQALATGAGSLASYMSYPVRRNEGQMFNAKLIATGEVASIGSGELSMAIGTESELETFAFNHDASVVNNQNLSYGADNFKGFRRVNSAFVELTANPLESLELQLAGRFDRYNDVGDTINPKFAMSYRPHRSTLLRTSIGTGFKPPGVSDMFMPTKVRNYKIYDEVACRKDRNSKACKGEYIDHVIVKNNEITFETSTHYNLGVIYQPTDDWTLTLDQWNFDGKGTISNFTGTNATEFEAENGNLDSVKDLGVRIEREDGKITAVQVPNVFNRSQKILRGVDLDAKYSSRQKIFGKTAALSFQSTWTHIFERKERTFSFSQLRSFAPYGSQTTNSISYGLRKNYVQLSARTLLNGDRDAQKRGWNFPTYTETDMTYAYTGNWGGKITFGIKNLIGSRPPIDRSGTSVTYGNTSSMFSPLGRRGFLAYNQDF